MLKSGLQQSSLQRAGFGTPVVIRSSLGRQRGDPDAAGTAIAASRNME